MNKYEVVKNYIDKSNENIELYNFLAEQNKFWNGKQFLFFIVHYVM